jgi:hypothetical protein
MTKGGDCSNVGILAEAEAKMDLETRILIEPYIEVISRRRCGHLSNIEFASIFSDLIPSDERMHWSTASDKDLLASLFKILNNLWEHANTFPVDYCVRAELATNPDPSFTTDKELDDAIEVAIRDLNFIGVDLDYWKRRSVE